MSSHTIPHNVSEDWKAAIDAEKTGNSSPGNDDDEGDGFDELWLGSKSPCSPESKIDTCLFATN